MRPRLEAWVELYVELWRTPGTERLGELFAEDATYSPGPYEPARSGLDAIAELWDAERTSHEERFEISTELVAVENNTGVARVEVRYAEPREQEYRDLWVIELDEAGRCVSFEEWPFWPPGSDGTVAGRENRS